jgi:hypothetical protein
MAYEIKLEVYTLGIRNERVINCIRLDSLFGNSDFFSFFQEYVSSFDKKLSLNKVQQKSIKFRSGSLNVNSAQRIISGIIDSGDYGIESSIVNIKTGIEKYHKTIEDTDIKPFYFLLYIPKSSDKAFVILQRLGIYGINGIFRTHLENFIKGKSDDLVVEFSPFISHKLAQSFINDGDIKEISLRRYNLPTDVTDKLGMESLEEDILSLELKITAKRKRSLHFNNQVKKFINNPNAVMFDIKELKSLGFNGEHKSSIKVRLGKNTRTIDLSETGQIRPYYDIDEEVKKDASGHPDFDSINNIAIKLLNDEIIVFKTQ